ncbi:MAG: IPT/TIG domain-containing protein [Pseudomonadota bacterium]
MIPSFRLRQSLLALLMTLLLVACGGGGGSAGGGRTSLSLDTTSVSLNAISGSSTAVTRDVTARYVGDGVVVGYGPGVPVPSWLDITTVSSTATQATFRLSARAGGLQPGSYNTTLRFVTGREDGSQLMSIDLPVTFTVAAAFAVTPTNEQLSLRVNSPPAIRNVSVSNGNWQAASEVFWMTVSSASGPSGTTMQVTVDPSSLAPGSYFGRVRFTSVTSGELAFYDVTLAVNEASFVFTPASAPTYTFREGGVDQQGSVRVQGPAQWLAGGSSGIRLQTESGSSGGTLNYSVLANGRSRGSYMESIRFTNGSGQAGTDYPIRVEITGVQLVATPATLSYVVDAQTTDAGLPRVVSIGDDSSQSSDNYNWTADAPSVPWLSLSPTSGTTTPATDLTLTLVKAELDKLPAGLAQTSVLVRYRNGAGNEETRSIPVSLDLRLPQFLSGMPYLSETTGGGSVVLGGSGFDRLAGAAIRIGSSSVSSYQLIDSKQLRLTLPALAVGRHAVQVSNALGLTRSLAEFVAVAPVSYAAATLATASVRPDVVFDRERQRVYLPRPAAGMIEVYQFANNAWTAGSSISVIGQPYGMELTPSGKQLLIATQSSLQQVPLDTVPLSASRLAQPLNTSCTARYSWLGLLNSLKLLLPYHLDSCGGPSVVEQLDLVTTLASLFPGVTPINGFVDASADGSRAVIGSGSASPTLALQRIEPTGVVTTLPLSANVSRLSLSADGARTLVNGESLYDLNFNLLGRLPLTHSVLSPDGRTAYALSSDRTMLDVYDVSSAASGGVYVKTRSITLSANPGALTRELRVANFGQLVVIAGDERTLLVPLR